MVFCISRVYYWNRKKSVLLEFQRKLLSNCWYINKTNATRKANVISAFDFSILYTTISHNLFYQCSSKNNYICFFKSETCTQTAFSSTSIHQISKGCGIRCFSKNSQLNISSYYLRKRFLTTGSAAFKQNIGIIWGWPHLHSGLT